MKIERGTGNRPLFLLTVSKKVLTVRTFLFYRLNLYGKGLTYINYGGTITYINYITYICYTTNVKECDPMRIVAVANQKGGVGKTTTSQALTAGLADKGYKVLGIDLDPQGNLSSACGSVNYNVPTIYELMKREVTAEETIQHMNGGYDIIPSNIMLAGAEQELSQTGKEHRLKEAIAAVSDNYDYIIVDTPPLLGVLTVNAFTVASDILIPTTAGIFATTGINQLNETVKSVQKYCNPNVKITGILFTRFNPRANISKQIKELTEQLSQYISAPIYKTYIRSAVAVEEAQANRVDIFDYAEKSTVSEDYKAFIEEFLKGEQE